MSRTLWRLRIALDVKDSRLSRENRSSLCTMMMSNGWVFEAASAEHLFERFAFFELPRCRVTFVEIFFCDFIPVLFRPVPAGPKLCLNGISLGLLVARDASVDDRGGFSSLLRYLCTHGHDRAAASSDGSVSAKPFFSRLRSRIFRLAHLFLISNAVQGWPSLRRIFGLIKLDCHFLII